MRNGVWFRISLVYASPSLSRDGLYLLPHIHVPTSNSTCPIHPNAKMSETREKLRIPNIEIRQISTHKVQEPWQEELERHHLSRRRHYDVLLIHSPLLSSTLP